MFIAQRLLRQSDATGRVSRPAIRIATAGVAVGVAVMLISIAMVLGFQQEVKNKVTGFGAHMQVLDFQSLRSMESCPLLCDDSVMHVIRQTEGVRHAARYCVKPGMLKTLQSFRGIQFRGIGPEYDLTFLRQHLVEGEVPTFSDTASTNQLLISQAVARQLNLSAGDRVYAYFFDKSVRARRFTVSGIYCTYMMDFDRTFVYTDLHTIHTLLGWQDGQCSGVEVRTDNIESIPQVQPQLIERIGRRQDAFGSYYSVFNVRELYPNVFSWLSLLDMDVWVILILMTCVAGFTMVSGLLIIILERTNFIGIMKAVGATNGMLQRIFLFFAAQIVGRGLLYGNVLAFTLLLTQHYFGIVRLDPEAYYMETVPVLFNWTYICAINVGTFIISLLAMILPSFLVAKIHPARSIRFE